MASVQQLLPFDSALPQVNGIKFVSPLRMRKSFVVPPETRKYLCKICVKIRVVRIDLQRSQARRFCSSPIPVIPEFSHASRDVSLTEPIVDLERFLLCCLCFWKSFGSSHLT